MAVQPQTNKAKMQVPPQQAQINKVTDAAAKVEEKQAKAQSESTDIVKVNPKAMQVEVGPKVIGMLDRALTDADKAFDYAESAKSKKYDALANMTMGIFNAAKADTNIDLSAAFSGDRKRMEKLNNQLGIALGYREVTTVADGDRQVQRVVLAKSVARYFPSATENKDSPEYQRKNTFRSNFTTTVKQCAQAAEGLRQANVKAEIDEKAGTLRISGPKVKEVFGQDNVLLNENASQFGKEKDKVLTAKPSFTAIRALGGDAHDAPVHRGTNTRGTTIGASAPKPTDPDTNMVSLAHMLIQGLGKLEGPVSDKVREALGQVVNAVQARLAQRDL
jgi:hypothetical protein